MTTIPSATQQESAKQSIDADLARLSLWSHPDQRLWVDGAWWPRSRHLARELPALLQALDANGTKMTRVSYDPTGWTPTAARIKVGARMIQARWFAELWPGRICLTGGRGERLDLDVIPSNTDPEQAAAVLAFFEASAGSGAVGT